MKKFPVTSVNGNEYLVQMGYGTFGLLFVDVCEPYIGLFGKQKFRKVDGIFNSYEERDYDYNYEAIAKKAVEEHEKNIAEESRRKMLREYNASKFEKWDGNCSE